MATTEQVKELLDSLTSGRVSPENLSPSEALIASAFAMVNDELSAALSYLIISQHALLVALDGVYTDPHKNLLVSVD